MSTLFHASDVNARPRAKQGRARMAEIAAENRIEIDKLMADLLAQLQRPPLPAERLLAETIGAATIRCRRLRQNGRCDTAERRELARLLRAFSALPTAAQARELATA